MPGGAGERDLRGAALRTAARSIFAEAQSRLTLRPLLQRKVLRHGSVLQIGGAQYDLAKFGSVLLIAIGKAAVPMTEGLLDVLEPALQAGQLLRGVVVGATSPAGVDPRLIYRVGSHPLPDRSSLEAAGLILQLVRRATGDTLVFFLISGGASAMVELPLLEDLPLSDLAGFYRGLVHSGLNIAEMNTLRKHLSAVKGGRLALAAAPAAQCTLLISDVPPGQVDTIGSGPSLPDPSTLSRCEELLGSEPIRSLLPGSVLDAFASGTLPETPKPDHPAFRRASFHTLLSNADLLAAAQDAARELGFRTIVDVRCDEAHYEEAAAYLLQRLRTFAGASEPVCLISGGELAVPVSVNAGIGGRNQQFALACADRIAGLPESVAVLSAGSDGVDGNSPAAGAVVDGTTVARAAVCGYSVQEAMAAFHAFPLLEAVGDTIVTGPSGNNLRDLRLLLLHPEK